MSSKTTRTRKSDIRDQIAADAKVAHGEAEAQAASAAAAAPVPEAPHRKIEHDDLSAIANMSMEDLAALMDGDDVTPVQVGQQISGPITRIGHDMAFVDVGGKSEGQIARIEIEDMNRGDIVTAFVIAADDDLLLLSRKLGGEGADAFLDEAAKSGLPVEGQVIGRNPGGFDVKIGSVRAFCPVSHIDVNPAADLDSYIGQELTFQILEHGDDTVVSRKALLKEQREENAELIWDRIAEGDTFTGTVSNVLAWGAFVDLGGVDGLVPVRELSWERGADATSIVTRGQSLDVQVLSVDRDARKITLTAKDPAESPWNTSVGTQFVEGGIYDGKLMDTTDFGAFVQLAPGLQGLLHSSRFPGGRSAFPEPGTTLKVRLDTIEDARRRLGLSHPEHAGDTGPAPAEMVTGKVTDVLLNGVVIELEGGQTAWLPAREVDLPDGTVMSQRFRRGRTVTARVADAGRGDRMTLTMKTDDNEGRNAWRKVKAEQEGAAGFGQLGALLKGWNKK